VTSETIGSTGDGQEAAPLPAVPGDVTGPPTGPAVYQDVTAPGGRRPVLPAWLRSRDAARHHARRVAGAAAHTALYHAVRSPVYTAQAVFWAVPGAVKLTLMWARWWLFPVPPEVYADALADGHRAWHRTAKVHRDVSAARAVISLAVIFAASGLFTVASRHVPAWGWVLAGLGVLPVLARYGRPSSVRIVGHATVPPEYEALTQDVIARALGSLGLAGINQWIREERKIVFASPVRQDGPGWRAEVDLPYGVTAAQVIERREQLASGLRRPLGAVWPEPVSSEHAGRLELWVGQRDISRAKAPPWPLLKSGQADVFRPLPFAVDVRGRPVKVPLAYHNMLLGSIPRQGKTAAVRVLACGAALDPLAELWIHELKGTGDLDPLECVSHRFVSGIDDDSVGYAAQSLRMLRAEVAKRGPRIKGLPPELCPERRVTREIAARKSLRLRPVICVIDEVQNLMGHPKHGKQAGDDAEFIIKVGPAMGIVLVLATQRPDKASLPTGVSANVSVRFALKMMDQWTNDAVLGTSAYQQGIRATTFRPKVDAGLGYLIGEDPAQVCRTYFLDVNDARAAVVRARAARERAGTLTGAAVGEDTTEPARDPAADAAAVFNGDAGLWWTTLAARLARRWPDRWAGATGDSVSAELRALGVPSVTVSSNGSKARGCRFEAVEAAAADGVTRRPEG
jgi:S-DNA-T family DNA segregation ATPase FtsK/SpoIIIE